MKRLTQIFIMLTVVSAASAERDAIHYRSPDGTAVIYNAVLVTKLEKSGQDWTFTALSHDGKPGHFEGPRVALVEFGESKQGRAFEIAGSAGPRTATVVRYEPGALVLADGSRLGLDSLRGMTSVERSAPSTEDAVAAVNAAFDQMMGGSPPTEVGVVEVVEEELPAEQERSPVKSYLIVGAGVLIGLALIAKLLKR